MSNESSEPAPKLPEFNHPIERQFISPLSAKSGDLVYDAVQAALVQGDASLITKIVEAEIQRSIDERALEDKKLDHEKASKVEELKQKAKALDNAHEIALRQEDRKDRQARVTQNNFRWIIGAFLVAFISALGYGVWAKDSNLADKVFTGAMGALGGGGGALILGRKSEEGGKPTPTSKDEG